MILFSLLASAPGQAQPYSDPDEGHRLAATWCSGCHQVEPRPGASISDAIPRFQAVADMSATTVLSIRVFLRNPHAAMPDLKLTDPQIDNLAAYILSLRAPAPKWPAQLTMGTGVTKRQFGVYWLAWLIAPRAFMAITRQGSQAPSFPIVCVGGSAGGLDAYTRLLHHLPGTMGVAIVIVNHLRTVSTLLHEILPRHSSMPVNLITDGMPVTQNRVFVIPEKRDLHVDAGAFRLKPISKPRGWPDVITVCLVSLTRHWPGQLIAVIVSGYDGDGAAALCGIQAVDGITIAQRPDTADIPDMPESAIASGCIDYILSPEAIAAMIIRIAQRPASSA